MIGSERYISKVVLKKEVDPHSYLAKIPALAVLADQKSINVDHAVTFFVGENGTGKSTLIEAIAVAYGFNPEGGTRNFQFSTVDAHSDLHEHLTLVKSNFPKDGFFLRAESYFNVASNIDALDEGGRDPRVIDSYGGVSLHEQSHGESFLSLVQHRFGGEGLYILDEPEAALSPMRLLTLMMEMKRLVDSGSQFIIATHSPILMAYPDATILEFSAEGIRAMGVQETEHFQLTCSILRDPSRFFAHFFEEDME